MKKIAYFAVFLFTLFFSNASNGSLPLLAQSRGGNMGEPQPELMPWQALAKEEAQKQRNFYFFMAVGLAIVVAVVTIRVLLGILKGRQVGEVVFEILFGPPETREKVITFVKKNIIAIILIAIVIAMFVPFIPVSVFGRTHVVTLWQYINYAR